MSPPIAPLQGNRLVGGPFGGDGFAGAIEPRVQVGHPNAAPVGANDEFVLAFLDDEVVHRDTRQVGVEGGPRGSAVQTRIASAVGAHEEAIFPVRGLN